MNCSRWTWHIYSASESDENGFIFSVSTSLFNCFAVAHAVTFSFYFLQDEINIIGLPYDASAIQFTTSNLHFNQISKETKRREKRRDSISKEEILNQLKKKNDIRDVNQKNSETIVTNQPTTTDTCFYNIFPPSSTDWTKINDLRLCASLYQPDPSKRHLCSDFEYWDIFNPFETVFFFLRMKPHFRHLIKTTTPIQNTFSLQIKQQQVVRFHEFHSNRISFTHFVVHFQLLCIFVVLGPCCFVSCKSNRRMW